MPVSDPIAAPSADNIAMRDYWELTDAIVGGAHSMRLIASKYLKQFPDEPKVSYDFRLSMTKLTNIYRDVVEALASKPFEQPITFGDQEGYKPPADVDEFIKNVDGGGLDITNFATSVFFAGINSAIDWIFVDYPNVSDNVKTMADAKAANLRPFWSRVLGKNMLEAVAEVVGGNEQLAYVRIYEPGSVDHVRVIKRDGDVVKWALFRKSNKSRKIDAKDREWLRSDPPIDTETFYMLLDQGVMSIKVIPLVPYWTGRRHGRTFCFSPVMQDAADLQVELYCQESDLKFASKMTAFPMLSANGVNPEMEEDNKTPKKLATGPSVVLWARPDGMGNIGNFAYVEPNATSLKFLAEEIKQTKQDLRELGRQPLTAQSGNLTVITTAVAAGKADSAVSAWGGMLALALENALTITQMFLGNAGEKIKVNVFDDFDTFDEGGADLTTLSTARKNRDISGKTYTSELKRRRVLSDDYDYEQDQTELLNEAPAEELTDDETKPDEKPVKS